MHFTRPQPNPDILRIHAEDAGFVALQRQRALECPNYQLVGIYDLEQRLYGHLDALVIAGETGREILWEIARDDPSPSAIFTLLNVHLRTAAYDDIGDILALSATPEHYAMLGAGAAWCAPDILRKVMGDWISSQTPLLRWIALDVCGRHRVDPRDHLARCLADPDHAVRSRAVRVAGEVGRVDTLDQISDLEPDTETLRARCLLGDSKAGKMLLRSLTPDVSVQTAREIAELAPLSMTTAEAEAEIRTLLKTPALARWAVLAIGVLGSAQVLPWLIKKMDDPFLARVAATAFMQITGVYIAYDDLELAEFPDDPDDPAVFEDPLESMIEANTPWPEPTLVAKWYNEYGKAFGEGTRYLFGVADWTISTPPEPWIKYQSRYRAVALTQAMRKPDAPLPNWQSAVHLEHGQFQRAW
jgi:uncharacterized protein (TIGR02270 family)